MIEIRIIDEKHSADINIQNEPFRIFGRLIPSYTDGLWSWDTHYFDGNDCSETCFPDENYDYGQMSRSCVFIGAYEGGKCIGLAIMQNAFFRYMYLYDLKVSRAFRRSGVGEALIKKAEEVCLARGYRGIYTIAQDNNLAACLFYLKRGFNIGGLDTNVYRGTKQEGKADIYFYKEAPKVLIIDFSFRFYVQDRKAACQSDSYQAY